MSSCEKSKTSYMLPTHNIIEYKQPFPSQKGGIGGIAIHKLSRANLNFVTPCLLASRACGGEVWAPKDWSSLTPVVLLVVAHMYFLLDWLYSLLAAFLSRHFIFLASLTSWGLHCYFGFTFTVSCIALSESTSRDSDLDTHCLVSNSPFV